MRRISDYDVKGRKVLIRVDFNCAVENGRIVPGERIEEHSKTIRKLAEKGAKVIILAHQGRKGKEDFLDLEQHAELIERYMGRPVKYVDDIIGEKAKSAIENLKDGETILLENVRALDDEMTEDGAIVRELSPLVDYYVLDPLSVAHRAQSSVVGFSKRIPAFYGDVIAKEISAVDSIKGMNDIVFVLGGSKAKDSFGIMRAWLSGGKAKKVLTGGALSILLLKAKGYPIGDSEAYFEKEELGKYLEDAKKMLCEFGDRIEVPVDVGVKTGDERIECDSDKIERGEIFDIGEKTIEKYKKIISDADAVVMNGPVGVYEEENFAKGTREILEAIADSKAYSLIGGGHTITAIKKFSMGKSRFGYVSLAGKALIEYLSAQDLPGIKALNENENKFRI